MKQSCTCNNSCHEAAMQGILKHILKLSKVRSIMERVYTTSYA